jgi:hypothetical protein
MVAPPGDQFHTICLAAAMLAEPTRRAETFRNDHVLLAARWSERWVVRALSPQGSPFEPMSQPCLRGKFETIQGGPATIGE